MKLGVNVDHIATLREARKTSYPCPVEGAVCAERAGADSIVMHLREDRRHIKERDTLLVKDMLKIPLNLEMSVNKNIVDFAVELKPFQATLVPEKRQELTTEAGLDIIKHYKEVGKTIERLRKNGIKTSIFVDPDKNQIKKAKELGAEHIEIHTGKFCDARSSVCQKREFKKIKQSAEFARDIGFFVAAGHGIDYENVKPIVEIQEIEELNIGHSIICKAVFVGIITAVKEMAELIKSGKR